MVSYKGNFYPSEGGTSYKIIVPPPSFISGVSEEHQTVIISDLPYKKENEFWNGKNSVSSVAVHFCLYAFILLHLCVY